jgi:phosphonate transport system substrate-binding protein
MTLTHRTARPSRRTALRHLASGIGAVAVPAWAQTDQRRTAYSVAVVPQFPAAELHRDWTPLLERIGHQLGISLTLKLAPSIPRFEAQLLEGQPDFAFLNPYHQVMASRAHGYLPLVRNGKPLTGILVVRKDSPIHSVRELAGTDIAFPSPNAFGASLWMRALLAERERIAFNALYVQTHGNVYRQVIRGRAAAGGGINNTLAQETPELRDDLRVLLETPEAASHPFSAHPRVAAALRRGITDALLSLTSDPSGMTLLKNVALPNPVAADHARDYRPLEQYKLDKYVVIER